IERREGGRERPADEGRLLHIVVHAPGCPGAGGEVTHVTGAKRVGRAILVGDVDLAFEDDDRLIPVKIPAERAGGAIPKGGKGGIVRASDMIGGARHGRALENPARFDRGIPQLEIRSTLEDRLDAISHNRTVRRTAYSNGEGASDQ